MWQWNWPAIIFGVTSTIIGVICAKSWEPIADFFGYPYDYKRRMEDHSYGVSKVIALKVELLIFDPEPLQLQRKLWLERAFELITDYDKIQVDAANCGWNFIRRCRCVREATKELKRAEDLATEGKGYVSEAKSKPRPGHTFERRHPQDLSLGMAPYRKAVVDFICKDGGPPRLGIWGMSGVGKTHLLELVKDHMTEYNSSKNSKNSKNNNNNHMTVCDAETEKIIVIHINAGINCTPQKVVDAIAAELSLPSLSDCSSQEELIHNYLVDKNFVLLVDDLWDDLEFSNLDIPEFGPTTAFGHILAARKVNHKLVFATRLRKLGPCMSVDDMIQIKCLNDADAATLFAHKVGDSTMKDTRLSDFIQMVVKECGGLPAALCKMGKAMSARSERSQWECAVQDWKDLKLHKVADRIVDFFNRMKMSYDVLDEQEQLCFLLCALWPEEENIPRHKLIGWWTGLGLLDGNPWTRGTALIFQLLECSLLDVGDNDMYCAESTHVKVHRMNRKMALWIVKNRGNKWISSSYCKLKLPMENWGDVERAWVSPPDTSEWLCYSSPSPQLSMLVCRGNLKRQPIPHFGSITFLDLEGTVQVDFPMEICLLTTLEHLDLSATSITRLPGELGELIHLKYLYVRHNSSLQTVDEGLILNFRKLQRFDIFCSGTSFFELPSFTSVLKDLVGKHDFMLGFTAKSEAVIRMLVQLGNVSTDALCLDHFKDTQGRDRIDMKLLCSMDSVRELCIANSNVTELIIQAEDGCKHLPNLEYFELINLQNLTKVVFAKKWLQMRVAQICNCRKLKDATWVANCENLEELLIVYCNEMVKIIDNNQGVHQPNVAPTSFPRLKMIYLQELPQLSTISDRDLQLKDLSYVCVVECNKLKLPAWPLNKHKHVKIDCSNTWWDKVARMVEAEERSRLHPTFRV